MENVYFCYDILIIDINIVIYVYINEMGGKKLQ